MADFDVFVKEFGDPINPEKPTADLLAKYRNIVPSELIELWEHFGFASFANGLVWITDPNQLEDVLSEWYPSKTKQTRLIPIIRTAFGEIIYWDGSTFILLDVHHNDNFDFGDDVELLFTYLLVSPKSKGSVLHEPLFKKALKKFGPLQSDEIYSYQLPLAMGGDNKLTNMTKMKMREQLSILAQVHGAE